MKKGFRVLSLVTALFMVLSLAACKGGSGDKTGGSSDTVSEGKIEDWIGAGSDYVQSIPDVSGTGDNLIDKVVDVPPPQVDLKGQTLTLFCWQDKNADTTTDDIANFKTFTGATLKIDYCDWGSYSQTFLTKCLSGAAPDLFAVRAEDNPQLMYKNMFLDITDKINFDDILWQGIKSKNSENYLDGKLYQVTTSGFVGRFIMYNKKMFTKEGVETPDVAYEAGTWTWEKLIEYAKKFTQDSNGDGQTDQFGFGGPFHIILDCMQSSAKTDYVVKKDKLHELTLDDPKLTQAADLLDRMYNVDKIMNDDGTALNDFAKGKVAMYIDGSWALNPNPLKQMHKDGEVSLVPIPKWNGSNEAISAGNWNMFAVPNKSKNVDAAIAYINMTRYMAISRDAHAVSSKKYKERGFTDKESEYMSLAAANIYHSNWIGVPDMSQTVYECMGRIRAGEKWATLKDEYKPKFQQQVDALNGLVK